MKVKFFISAVMLLVATSANAQFQSNPSSSTSTASNEDSYNAIYFQYNPQTLKIDEKGADDESGYNGIAFGWKKGVSIMKSHPLFLEAGLAFQYTFYSEEEELYDSKFNMGTLSVPVNVTYRYAIPNSSVTIAPYLGLTLKGNLWAKRKYEYENNVSYKDEEIDLFDDDDMGSSKYTANRLQVAWQLGLNVNFKTIYLGVGYGSDLGDFLKDVKFSTTYLTLGFNL